MEIEISKLLAPENYRKKFDKDKLASLADSIRERGILQNILVMPAGDHGGGALPGMEVDPESLRWRIVSGERRFRATLMALEALAAEAAGLPEGPARDAVEAKAQARRMMPCRVLGPDEVAEARFLQIIENTQREDVPLADEVACIAGLVSEGIPVVELAAKLGIDREWVRRRNQLALCPASLMKALTEGSVTMRVALAVCQLPDQEARKEITQRILKPVDEVGTLGEAAVKALIEREFMLPLKDAPWPLEWGFGGEGPCEGCPHLVHRGAASFCVSPSCFRRKAGAAWEARLGDFLEAGKIPIRHDEAAEIFTGAEGAVAPDCDWLGLEEQVEFRVLGHFGKKTWRDYLRETIGQPIQSVARIHLALHPRTFREIELVGKAAVRLILRQAAKAKTPEPAEPEAQVDDSGGDELPGMGSHGSAQSGPVAATMEADSLAMYSALVAKVAAMGGDVLTSPAVLSAIGRARVRRMPLAMVRRWAEVCGVDHQEGGDSREEMAHALATAHPTIREGWLLVGLVIEDAQDAGDVLGALEGVNPEAK